MSKYDIFRNQLYTTGDREIETPPFFANGDAIGGTPPYSPSSYRDGLITEQDWADIQKRHEAFLADNEKIREELDVSLDESQGKADSAQQTKLDAEAEKEVKQQEKTDKEALKATAESDIAALEAEITKTGGELNKVIGVIEDLKSQIDNETDPDTKAEKELELKNSEAERTRLEEKLAADHSSLAEKTDMKTALTADIQSLTAAIVDLTQIAEAQITIINVEEQEAEKIRNQIAEETARAEHESNQYSAIEDRIGSEELTVVPVINQPVIRLLTLQEMQEVKRKLESYEERLDRSKIELAKITKDIAALETEGKEVPKKLIDEQARLEENIESLTDGIPSIKSQIKAMEDTTPLKDREVDVFGYVYSVDTDGDGTGDFGDLDIDGDGVDNESDAFPYNSNESVDTDGDGIGDEADLDDDNDGMTDLNEIERGTDPKDPDSVKGHTTMMRLGQQVGQFLTSDFKKVEGESTTHFEEINDELAELSTAKLSTLQTTIDVLNAAQAENKIELGENNVAAMFSVFDGVYEEGKGEASLPAAIRNLGLKEDQENQLKALIVTLSDTQDLDYANFTEQLGNFVDAIGGIAEDEVIAIDYTKELATRFLKEMQDAIGHLRDSRAVTHQALENIIKTLQKALDMRGMVTADGVAWYSDMEDGSSRVLTNDLYAAAKMALKAEIDAETLPLDQWAIESSKLLLRHVGKNDIDNRVYNDQLRRNDVYMSIPFHGLNKNASMVKNAIDIVSKLQQRIGQAILDTDAEAVDFSTQLTQFNGELGKMTQAFEADKAEYETKKAEAEAAVEARAVEKAAAYDAYKSEAVEEQIAIKFQDYLIAHSLHMKATMALSKINYEFAATNMIFSRNSRRLQIAIPTITKAIESATSVKEQLQAMIASLTKELQDCVNEIDPINGHVGLAIASLTKMDENWATGNELRENDQWTPGDREYNANYAFVRSEVGALVDPVYGENIIAAY